VTDRLLVGLEYNAVVSELSPTANYTLLFETAHQPMVSLGTSSDRILSPEGTRATYITFGKTLPNTRIAPYLSINYSSWERGFNFPFGVNFAVHPQWDAMVQHDGRNTHWLLTYKTREISTSLLLIKGRYWGLSLGLRF
jgi:hypothetical protein